MPKNLRILSLLPAATEIVYLLGLEDSLVGVSHECDYPSQALSKPQVTSSIVDNTMSSNLINEKVKKVGHRGPGVFHLKEGILEKLRPNLILTQELCEVCAVGFKEVKKAARILDSDVKIISLEPEGVEDILSNILLIGEATGTVKRAEKVVKNLQKRLEKIPKIKKKPRVLVIEWLSPIMVAGHWVPEMVEIAGGKNILTSRGSRSKIIELDQIRSAKVDLLVISPCGFDIKRTKKEMPLIDKITKELPGVRVEFIDGNAYMTRPGPRIIDGIEILSDMILSS